jgi:hypothetical protein
MQDFFFVYLDVSGLMGQMGFEHRAEEWWLSVDLSKVSLKAVLFCSRNQKPTNPVTHAIGIKEMYERIRHILSSIKYKECHWQFPGDLNVYFAFTVIVGGFTQYSCFLCLWDSQAPECHYC